MNQKSLLTIPVVAVAWLTLTFTASADLGTPRSAVVEVICQVQDGKVVGVDLEALENRPRHSMTKESFIKLLGGIDTQHLVFQPEDKDKNIYWFYDAETQKYRVRLLEPKRIDFEVGFVEDKTIGCKGYFVVTAVNP